MRTPFDTVIRTRRREIDHMRLTIHAESTRLVEIDEASETLREELLFEYGVAAETWAMSTEAYLRRNLSQRAHLHAQRLAVSQELDNLRRSASEAYGSMVVLENAADGFRSDSRRRQQRAEQLAGDDLSAARSARRTKPDRVRLGYGKA